jgi:hypothetical protein
MSVLRAQRGVLRPNKNGVISGKGVVLDRLDAKQPHYEDKKDEPTPSRVGGLAPSRKAGKMQKASFDVGRKNDVQPMFAGQGAGEVPNGIKIPQSLRKKTEKRNNIKLVF